MYFWLLLQISLCYLWLVLWSRVTYILVMQSWILSISTQYFSVTWSFLRNDCNILIFWLSMLTTVVLNVNVTWRCLWQIHQERAVEKLSKLPKSSSVNVKTHKTNQESSFFNVPCECVLLSAWFMFTNGRSFSRSGNCFTPLHITPSYEMTQSAYSYIPSKASRLQTKDPSPLPGLRASFSWAGIWPESSRGHLCHIFTYPNALLGDLLKPLVLLFYL